MAEVDEQVCVDPPRLQAVADALTEGARRLDELAGGDERTLGVVPRDRCSLGTLFTRFVDAGAAFERRFGSSVDGAAAAALDQLYDVIDADRTAVFPPFQSLPGAAR